MCRLHRRDVLTSLAALPLATLGLDRAARAGAISFLDRAELIDGVQAIIARAKSPELREARVLDLRGSELPWKDLGITLNKGQEVTFLLGGRVWLSREQDLWVEPGVALHVRTRGSRPMFNPMSNTGTMTATADGPLEMARSLVEFQDAGGELAVPKDAYAKADAHIYGLALVWRGKAQAGLSSLLRHGDVCGVIAAELARLQSPRRLPAGWHNFFMLGGGPVIFNDIGNGAIAVEPLKNAGILQRCRRCCPKISSRRTTIFPSRPSMTMARTSPTSGAGTFPSARPSAARFPAGRRSNRTWRCGVGLPISASGCATSVICTRTTRRTSAARPSPSSMSGCSACPCSSAAAARPASPTWRFPSREPHR
jgi:hypothetical protein